MQPSDRHGITHIESPRARAKHLRPYDEIRYELPFGPSLPALVYADRLRNPDWSTPIHIHEYAELCYVAEGGGRFILDGVIHEARQGDVFVTKPHEVHSGVADGGGPFTLYSLGFLFEDIDGLEADFYVLGPNRIVRDGTGTVKEWWERLMAECETEAPYAKSMAKAYLSALIAQVLRLYAERGEASRPASPNVPPYIKNVLSAMHLASHPRPTIEELAKASGVSRSHLDREFKRILGIAPGEYVRQLECERAKQALRHSKRSVTEISDELGFESVQAFAMFFKRVSGLTPQAYRKSFEAGGPAGEDDEKRENRHQKKR